MKKFIFILMLAIVSSVWTMSGALCLGPIPNAMYQPFTTVSGTFVSVPIPCEPSDEYPCPACLTLALQTSDHLYYLTADNADIQTQLEAIEYQLSLTTNITGSVSGTPYTEESYEYIRVQAVDTNSAPLRLPSICDEWNVLVSSFCWPTYSTGKYYLSTDTIINGQHYKKLTSDYYSYLNYKGAMREGDNRDIYYIPVDSSHEYLLYAFNAKVGDMLTNLYIGGFGEESGHSGVVESISDDSPRVFTIRVNTPADGIESGDTYLVRWIEGVGSPETPCGMAVVPSVPVDIGVYTLLCAYKNGEQVYTSEMGEKYGCEYNYDPSQPMFPSDTKWHYVYTEMYGGPDFTPIYFSDSPIDTVINNTQYQRIGGILFRSEGAKVWCVKDSMGTLVEQLVYDFDLQVGDSILNIFYEEDPDFVIPSYAKVTKVENITLSDGRSARRLSYDAFRYDDIEHIGSLDGFLAPLNLPVPTCGCGDQFQCCTRGDFLLFEIAKGACDTFMEDNHPYVDTIPLYVKDNPGSSTVDPADPNLIYAVLEGDMLIIKDFTGAEIIFTLTNNGSLHSPARARRTQSQTFTDSTSVELTENGLYDIELTSEAWDYMVFGSFDFNKIHEAVERIQEERPAASKIFRNGQLLIRHGDQLYTPSGVQVQ